MLGDTVSDGDVGSSNTVSSIKYIYKTSYSVVQRTLDASQSPKSNVPDKSQSDVIQSYVRWGRSMDVRQGRRVDAWYCASFILARNLIWTYFLDLHKTSPVRPNVDWMVLLFVQTTGLSCLRHFRRITKLFCSDKVMILPVCNASRFLSKHTDRKKA